MRKRLGTVMKHEEHVLNFNLRVLDALQKMDKILHSEASSRI
jgi:hypothetical protein